MEYITYEKYSEFGFSLVPEAQFKRFAMLAKKEVDYRTSNRITEVTDDVQLTTSVVVDILFTSENEGEVTSVSTDGYSESYANPVSSDEKITLVVLKYLPQGLTSWVMK